MASKVFCAFKWPAVSVNVEFLCCVLIGVVQRNNECPPDASECISFLVELQMTIFFQSIFFQIVARKLILIYSIVNRNC